MDLGHRLKLFRVSAGIKQGELGKRLKVSANHIYMIESGRREPSLDYLKQFSKVVNVPMSVIFLEPADGKDAQSRALTERFMALMAEFAEVTGVKSRRS